MLRPAVDAFFDSVMVMAEEALRANRLALLGRLRGLFMHAADLSRLPGWYRTMQALRSLIYTLLFIAVTAVFGVIVLGSAVLPLSLEQRYVIPRTWGGS